jgi:hypothetical protein
VVESVRLVTFLFVMLSEVEASRRLLDLSLLRLRSGE